MSVTTPASTPVNNTVLQECLQHITDTFSAAGIQRAVVAVSGGIDSAVSLTLACRALGSHNVYPLFLPLEKKYENDEERIATLNKIPEKNWHIFPIRSVVESLQTLVGLDTDSPDAALRMGNMMARTRMIIIYDLAKKLDALVCGTENKSEKYLGYFTRYGDEASDLEPIQHLYKTQIRSLAKLLEIPDVFLTKAPTAGLWEGQKDELELGFSYHDADEVLWWYIDQGLREQVRKEFPLSSKYYVSPQKIKAQTVWSQTVADISQHTGIDSKVVDAVMWRVESMQFKHQVPYTL